MLDSTNDTLAGKLINTHSSYQKMTLGRYQLKPKQSSLVDRLCEKVKAVRLLAVSR